MNEFDEKEFLTLCERFNVNPECQDVQIEYESEYFFNQMQQTVEKDRKGEVVFCVIRPNGKIICITCKEYPEGIYRIPTGGIGYGEDIIDAVYREVKEELGLETHILGFGGVLKIKFIYRSKHIMFYSYIFFLRETAGRLLEDAIEDEVSNVDEVDLRGLGFYTEKLNNIQGKWRDWGKFRYASCMAVLNYLKNNALI